MANNDLILWQRPDTDLINESNVSNLVLLTNSNLTPKQQNQIVKAFNDESYEMASQYAWTKAMAKLKKSLMTLGLDFIADILRRTDIDEYSSPDEVLTEKAAIDIAEQLGVIGKTAAFKLRQSHDLVRHFMAGDADAEMERDDAVNVLKTSIQFILGEQSSDVAKDFSLFRERILTETISLEDPTVCQIINAPLFYVRTVCTILLTAIKREKGIRQEQALTNINIILPSIWKGLADSDRYHIGEAFRDVSASGDTIATKGLKQALSAVQGFDYVPETLRSNTFKDCAKKLISVHYEFDNFYKEVPAVKALVNLGSIIPMPAFTECMDAFLVVCLGNSYGVSRGALPIAKAALENVNKERWQFFFDHIVEKDEHVLYHLKSSESVRRMRKLMNELTLLGFSLQSKTAQQLYEALLDETKTTRVQNIASSLYNKLSSLS